MKRATTIAILGALVLGTAAIAAGARARQPISVGDMSDRHKPRSELRATTGSPGESHVAPSPPAGTDSEPRPQLATPPEGIDWGNPYDLMLHGIPTGKTRDMR
jgi:uncharacterized low-complexity protein